MIQPLNRLSAVFLLGFAVVALALGYWQVARAPELLARDDNPRLVEAERRFQRGRLLDRHGETLAYTEIGLTRTHRVYPYPSLASVTGYYSLRYGTGGLEASYDAPLRGADRDPFIRWVDGLLHRPGRGDDVVTTIDLNLQRKVDEILGERRGAVVVMDPRTGEILALASHPTYDPNRLDEEWDALQAALGSPLLNRATQGQYPPGSVFKTVTLAAALEEGLTDPTEVFTDATGTLPVGTFIVRCRNHPGRTRLTLGEAYAFSCNVAFAELGLRLGEKRLREYAGRFGIGQAPAVPLPVATGQLADTYPLGEENLAMTAIGQGELLVSPLQMALVAATIANDGVRPAPRLVLEVWRTRAEKMEPVPPPGEPVRVVSRLTAWQVRAAMQQAVTEGWAQGAALPGVAVAGKTGTAQVGPLEQAVGPPPHSWFIGFAPADAPQVVVALVVEHGGLAAQVAAPLGGRVLQAALEGN